MTYSDFQPSTKKKNKYKNLKKQEIQDIFIDTNNTKPIFSMVWNPKYDGYKRGLASMFYNLFDEEVCYNSVGALKINLHEINNALEKNCINQSLENLKDLRYVPLLTTNFGHAIHQ